MVILIRCIICKEPQSISVDEDDLKDYQKGKKVQHAFPYLNAEQRELFITQYCYKCWDEIFDDCEE